MAKCLVGGHVVERSPGSERASRRGDDDPLDGLQVSAGETLRDRGVLGIDRLYPPASSGRGSEAELSAGHEAFLVGESEDLARGQRGERRSQPCGPNDRVEHDVGLVEGRKFGRRLGSDAPAIEIELSQLGFERLGIATNAESDHPEAIGVLTDDFEGLEPDGAGGAQNDDVLDLGHRMIVTR